MSKEQSNQEKRYQELSKKSDHELLVEIVLQLQLTNEVLGIILTDWMNQQISGVKVQGDSYDGSLGKIAGDIHQIRRKLVGPSSTDPEEH